ncbi:hypothetical protein KAZ92_01160 [Candidatus Gracilibacteria bacterium]|jgi:hypothetical protein|nr:hypothetical protein [Candidatus Gracilibacteria bacterium]
MKLRLLYREEADVSEPIGAVFLDVDVAEIFDTKEVAEQHLSEALNKKSTSGDWILKTKDVTCVILSEGINRPEMRFPNIRQ